MDANDFIKNPTGGVIEVAGNSLTWAASYECLRANEEGTTWRVKVALENRRIKAQIKLELNILVMRQARLTLTQPVGEPIWKACVHDAKGQRVWSEAGSGVTLNLPHDVLDDIRTMDRLMDMEDFEWPFETRSSRSGGSG